MPTEQAQKIDIHIHNTGVQIHIHTHNIGAHTDIKVYTDRMQIYTTQRQTYKHRYMYEDLCKHSCKHIELPIIKISKGSHIESSI